MLKKYGIFIISYKRADIINTYKLLPPDSYKVIIRESELEDYKAHKIPNLLPVKDELIDDALKCCLYPKDYLNSKHYIVLDDDITSFYDRSSGFESLTPDEVIERMLKIISIQDDLRIGYGGTLPPRHSKTGKQGFVFNECSGAIKFINSDYIKAKLDKNLNDFQDIDFVCQELLHNRVVLINGFFVCDSAPMISTKGGDNDKSLDDICSQLIYLKNKWRKYVVAKNHILMANISVPR